MTDRPRKLISPLTAQPEPVKASASRLARKLGYVNLRRRNVPRSALKASSVHFFRR